MKSVWERMRIIPVDGPSSDSASPYMSFSLLTKAVVEK